MGMAGLQKRMEAGIGKASARHRCDRCFSRLAGRICWRLPSFRRLRGAGEEAVMNLNDDNEQLIETLFRNGTLTVVGIVLSFSLGFLSQWANNPLPWSLIDAPPVLLLCAGIVWEIVALIGLLKPAALKKHVFEKANKRFVTGVILTSSGVFCAIVIDLAKLLISQGI
jgi:hypothetical protein